MSYLDAVLSMESKDTTPVKHLTILVDDGFDIIESNPELVLSLESSGIEYSIVKNNDITHVAHVPKGHGLEKMVTGGDINAVVNGVYEPELDTNRPRDFRTIRVLTMQSKNKPREKVDGYLVTDETMLSVEKSHIEVEDLINSLGW